MYSVVMNSITMNSSVTRVYLIFQTTMFRDAVSAVLAGQSEIHLAGIRQEGALIARDLVELEPDVIILEENAGGAVVVDALSLLTSTIPCRLITLRLDADGMHVWSQTWHHTVQSDNLVEAILSARCSDRGEQNI